MSCNLYMTVRGQIRSEKYKSLDDLMVAYQGVKERHRPAWAYDDAGALVLGVEPDGFERPTSRALLSGFADGPRVAAPVAGS